MKQSCWKVGTTALLGSWFYNAILSGPFLSASRLCGHKEHVCKYLQGMMPGFSFDVSLLIKQSLKYYVIFFYGVDAFCLASLLPRSFLPEGVPTVHRSWLRLLGKVPLNEKMDTHAVEY